jgi:DNA-directed RNA polymerase subunit RPC12/RpoP
MRNRYKGVCGLCGKNVPPKQGRWHIEGYEKFGKSTQKFSGLRCLRCGTTTKKGLKILKEKGLINK